MSENIKKNQDIKVNGDEEKVEPSKKKTIEEYYVEDFELKNYQFHKTIKMEMRK